MLFKNLHKNDNKDSDELVETTEEDLDKKYQRALKKCKRNARIKSCLLLLLLSLGIIGGYRALFTQPLIETSAEAINNYAFAEEYLNNYFAYPKSEEISTYLNQFTTGSWLPTYDSKVKEVSVSNVEIYKVKQLENKVLHVYAKINIKYNSQENKTDEKSMHVLLSILNKENRYLVNEPIKMQSNSIGAMSQEEKLAYTNNYAETEGTDCTEQEKIELENTMQLFFTTYAADYPQSQLLMEDPKSLDKLDENTKLQMDSIGSARKTEDRYYVNATVNVSTHEVLVQQRTYQLEIDVKTNKIKNMEVF